MFLQHQLKKLFLCQPLQGLHIQRWQSKCDYLAIPTCSSGKQLQRFDARGVHNTAVLHTWMQLFFLGAEEQGTIPSVQRSSVWEYNLIEMVEA